MFRWLHIRHFSVIAAIVLLATGLTPRGVEASVVTAEYVPADFSSISTVAGFNNGSTFLPAQTFTPTVSGTVDEIGVGIWSTGANLVLVELLTTEAGLPGVPLAVETIPGGPFTDGVFHTANFSAWGIHLSAGSVYAISLRTENPSPNVGWSGGFENLYTGGVFAQSLDAGFTWSSVSDRSAAFRVTVTAVPEAGAWLLVGAVAIGVGAVRRFRRS